MDADDDRLRFERLAHEVWQPLYRYLARRAPRDDVEDLLSETLVVVWRRRAEVPSPALPWCYAVARGVLSNASRGEQRHTRLLGRLRNERPSGPPAELPHVDAALARLRPGEAEVLRLWAWEGLEPLEIAQVLGIGSNAAAARLSRARRALRRELGQDPAPSGHKTLREG